MFNFRYTLIERPGCKALHTNKVGFTLKARYNLDSYLGYSAGLIWENSLP